MKNYQHIALLFILSSSVIGCKTFHDSKPNTKQQQLAKKTLEHQLRRAEQQELKKAIIDDLDFSLGEPDPGILDKGDKQRYSYSFDKL